MSIQQYALLDVSAHTIDHRRTTRSRSQAIPPTESEYLAGVDATVAEGWLDLKVKTTRPIPIRLSSILTAKQCMEKFCLTAQDVLTTKFTISLSDM